MWYTLQFVQKVFIKTIPCHTKFSILNILIKLNKILPLPSQAPWPFVKFKCFRLFNFNYYLTLRWIINSKGITQVPSNTKNSRTKTKYNSDCYQTEPHPLSLNNRILAITNKLFTARLWGYISSLFPSNLSLHACHVARLYPLYLDKSNFAASMLRNTVTINLCRSFNPFNITW